MTISHEASVNLRLGLSFWGPPSPPEELVQLTNLLTFGSRLSVELAKPSSRTLQA